MISFIEKHKKKITFIAIFILLVILVDNDYNYTPLLQSDEIRLIDGKGDVNTIENLQNVFKDTTLKIDENEIIVVKIIRGKDLHMSILNMERLYTMEFAKDDKVIRKIKVMTPRTQRKVKLINKKRKVDLDYDEWQTLDGKYVVLMDKHRYISFGDMFFSELNKLIK